MSEFKPCPFCGNNITGWKDHKEDCYFILWVEDSISLNVPRELLDKAWNTRTGSTCEGCAEDTGISNSDVCEWCERNPFYTDCYILKAVE